MLGKTLQTSIGLLAVSFVTAAALSIGAHSAAAEDARHHIRHAYPSHHRTWLARGGATLPYALEYGFLRHVPPNAIGGPGYTFVPGVGILGESCDLPSSACTNEYRDVH
jgi:hypothetical protein